MKMRYQLNNNSGLSLEYILKMVSLVGLTSFFFEAWPFFVIRGSGVRTFADTWILFAWVLFIALELLLFAYWEEAQDINAFKTGVYQEEVIKVLKRQGMLG